jgi:hypothetical protein
VEAAKQTEGGATMRTPRWPGIAALFVACYVLSIGPAVWLMRAGILSLDWFGVIYGPVLWLCDHCKPADQVFDWYIRIVAGE